MGHLEVVYCYVSLSCMLLGWKEAYLRQLSALHAPRRSKELIPAARAAEERVAAARRVWVRRTILSSWGIKQRRGLRECEKRIDT
jgi:hypothetical protein